MTPEPQKTETLEREPHEFIPGVKLWGQRLCRWCYKPFYYDIHWPSFAKDHQPSGKEGEQW